jgi:hypothetical protein
LHYLPICDIIVIQTRSNCMKKKILFSIILFLALALLAMPILTSCSKSENGETTNESEADTVETAPKITIPAAELTKRPASYLLLQDTSYNGYKEGIRSGWRYDCRGGVPAEVLELNYGTLTDISAEYGTAMIREFNRIDSGILMLETSVSLTGGFDGFSLEFRNDSDKPVYKLVTRNGGWCIATDSGETPLDGTGGRPAYRFRIYIDLDRGESATYIDDTKFDSFPLLQTGDALNILNFRFATDEASTAIASPGKIRITANYALNEDFGTHPGGKLSYGWQGEGAAADAGMLKVGGGYAEHSFEPVGGVVSLLTEFNLTRGQAITVTASAGGEPVISFTADKTAFYVNGSEIYTPYVQNLWYRLRMDIDTAKSSALIWINGRKIAELPLLAVTNHIDGVRIDNADSVPVYFDGVSVFEKILADDYPGAPVKPESEGEYTVGMNVCSLWKEGTHWGWSCVSAYEDAEPVLGYYDEGVPETADWEIKYMAEHGIDFQAFCWYATASDAPLKAGPLAAHLHDGYMYAEYSEDVKYCLIWECQNAARPSNFNSWRDYFVPYLLEYYIKDSRHMVIDNQPVLCVFGAGRLSETLGGEANVKKCFDYLEDEVRKLGFDGMIYLSCGSASDSLAKMGFDASYAYNWGTSGCEVNTNINGILNSAANKSMYTVPTISVGFNSIPWHGTRYPMMTVEDYKTAHLWVRDEYLPKYADKNGWQDKFVMLSTWNEYGEGTYIMPSAGNGGFGYLDVIRSVYAGAEPDEDINTIPTAAQKERINHLYPQYRRLLRKTGYYSENIDVSTLAPIFEIDYSVKSKISIGSALKPVFGDDGLRGTVNGDTLIIKDGISVKASDSPYIRVTLDVPKGTACEVFYITDKDKSWTQDKSAQFTANGEGAAEYLINMSEKKLWKDTIIAFRVDPGQTADGAGDPERNYFRLVKTEFLSCPERPSRTIYINGRACELQLWPEVSENGETLISWDGAAALNYRLSAFDTWDYAAKTLTIEMNGHKAVFTVGKDSWTLDGEERPLGYTLYKTDGLPMLPLAALCEAVGYTCSLTEKSELSIDTPLKAYYEKTGSRTKGEWEFDTPGDTEGWSSPHMSLFVSAGGLTVNSVSDTTDPIISYTGDIDLTASEYTALEVRCRYKYDSAYADHISVYFTSDSDGTMSESMSIKLPLSSADSEGEWETLRADLTGIPTWEGIIKQLRFDPFNAVGSMEIDYIRFMK